MTEDRGRMTEQADDLMNRMIPAGLDGKGVGIIIRFGGCLVFSFGF